MRKAGLSDERQLAYAPPPISMMQGRDAFAALINRHPDTEAVLCVSDPCAFGALTYCLERGWSVPEKIAIAGFGAFEISECCVPPISTLAVSGAEIGEKAAQLILDIIDKTVTQAQSIDIHCQPLLRASTTKAHR